MNKIGKVEHLPFILWLKGRGLLCLLKLHAFKRKKGDSKVLCWANEMKAAASVFGITFEKNDF